MTDITIVHTNVWRSYDAGRSLGIQIGETMLMEPDVVLLFAAPHYEHAELLQGFYSSCQAHLLIGCSSAGEFTPLVQGEGLACALAISSQEMSFSVAIGRGLSCDPPAAASEIATTFESKDTSRFRYQTMIVLADVRQGGVEGFLRHLTVLTDGGYEIVGGGAGDNAHFRHTPVFCGTEVLTDAVVALAIRSYKPFGIGGEHGWRPASASMRITGVQGTHLLSLDGLPAVEVFKQHAQQTGQCFDEEHPLPFFLNNVLGLEGAGYLLRVPLALNRDGSIRCASELPARGSIAIMKSCAHSPVEAAQQAVRSAQHKLYGCQPAAALFFDCVATRLHLGTGFGLELGIAQQVLGDIPLVGCNTHGQVVRKEGQFSSFHNCTAVVCLIPQ